MIKRADRAEANRFYNFPNDAIEEVLSSAVHHKSYEIGSPIEVQVWPDKILILSFPGPVPPVNAQILKSKRLIVAREYRNRRIGDFLKELHLTEGRGTGFPTIYDAMENNDSPTPIFETDDATYVLVNLPVHELFEASIQVSDQADLLIFNSLDDVISFSNQARKIVSEQIHSKTVDLLEAAQELIKRAEFFENVGLSNKSKNRTRYFDPLLGFEWIKAEFPDKKTSPNQCYKITESGTRLLNLLK